MPMTPREIATAYVDLINEKRYDEVAEMWAGDGELRSPQGWVFKGKEAANSFYSGFKDWDIPPMCEVSYYEDTKANRCTLELATRMTRDAEGHWQSDPDAEFSWASLDLFIVNDEWKVQSMIAYVAPPSRWLQDSVEPEPSY